MFLICGAVVSSAEEPAAARINLDYNLYLEGRFVYERNCLVCHGQRGDGKGELSKELQPKPRSFREGLFKFRSTPFGALPTEDDLRRTITGGLSGTAMGAYVQLQSEEVRAVIEYIKSFSRRWRSPENYAESISLPERPGWLKDGETDPAHAAAGRKLFEAHCAACHGTDAAGKGPASAGLVDVWGMPAVPVDLRQPHLRCGDDLEDVFRVLSTGLNGTPMISFDQLLTESQRWDIVAYVASIRLPSGPVIEIRPKPVR